MALARVCTGFHLVACFAMASADFVGAGECAKCHQPEFQKQSKSRHAAALRPAGASPALGNLLGHTVRENNGLEFDYVQGPEGVTVTARRGDQRASAVLEWAFGAGAQGVTPIGRIGGKYLEHRVSWYGRESRTGLTVGHTLAPPPAISSALGQPQSDEVIYRCFNCHATAVEKGLDLTSMRPGVECERCHGPGAAHLRRPSPQTIRNPGRLSPAAIIAGCGECHRLPYSGNLPSALELAAPENIRFAPIGLLGSRCFQAGGKLSCLTCHDPHEDARQDPQFYTAKCLECHPAAALSAASQCRRASGENCLPCHMPKSSPLPHLQFTDHRIRTVNVSLTSWQAVEQAIGSSDLDRARRLLEAIPSRSSRWHLLSSRIYDGLGDPARAVSEAEAAVDLDPQNAAAYLHLGQIFLSHNTPGPALEFFSEATKVAPGSLLTHLGRGLALKDLQRFDDAETEFAFCLRRDRGMGTAFDALAAMYLQMSDSQKLAAASEEYLKANPSDYRGYYYLAAAREQLKQDGREAEALLRRALELNPSFAASHALLGKLLTQGQRLDEAARELEWAIRLRPDYLQAHLYLANAYRKLGRSADASTQFQIVKNLNEKQQAKPSLIYHKRSEKK